MRDITYPPVILTAKTLFKVLDLKFQMSGTENIPRQGGAILAANHIGYVDFIFDGFAAQPSKRLVRFMAKKEAFDHRITGPIMRSLHHISVDREQGVQSYRDAVDYARSGEIVGIFPEATISRSFEIKELKTGAVRMAAEAGVPLIPMVTWGTQLLKTKDHPSDLKGRGKTIGLHVGEPLEVTGADPGGRDRAAARVDDSPARQGHRRVPDRARGPVVGTRAPRRSRADSRRGAPPRRGGEGRPRRQARATWSAVADFLSRRRCRRPSRGGCRDVRCAERSPR